MEKDNIHKHTHTHITIAPALLSSYLIYKVRSPYAPPALSLVCLFVCLTLSQPPTLSLTLSLARSLFLSLSLSLSLCRLFHALEKLKLIACDAIDYLHNVGMEVKVVVEAGKQLIRLQKSLMAGMKLDRGQKLRWRETDGQTD